MKNIILDTITGHYLNTNDFNGIILNKLIIHLNIKESLLKQELSKLIHSNDIDITSSIAFPNPHIKAYEEESKEKQLEYLDSESKESIGVYPSRKHLKSIIDVNKYSDKPFTLLLAKGEPQLSFLCFDLTILENYRNDPRYHFYNDDLSGRICIKEEFMDSENIKKKDEILLQSFGFAYNKLGRRCVAVFLRYLTHLSSSHQQLWKMKEVEGDYELHPGYRRIASGNWQCGISIFNAICNEMKMINDICKIINRDAFFKRVFDTENKPKNFSYILRPTRKEFNDFILTIDKILSENINIKFFKRNVPKEYVEIKNGKQVVTRIGTISMLDDWLSKLFSKSKIPPHNEMIKTLKYIRTLRQSPAHKLEEDLYDSSYFVQQKNVCLLIYEFVRNLRFILSSHPLVKDPSLKKDYSEEIWNG